MPRNLTLLFSLLLLVACDQVPTSMDGEPLEPISAATQLALDLEAVDFDFLTETLFLSLAVEGGDTSTLVTTTFIRGNANPAEFLLNDLGQDHDILAGDGQYDLNLTLSPAFDTLTDTLWTFILTAQDGQSGDTANLQEQYRPQVPHVPLIEQIVFKDTVQLISDSLVFDTLLVTVSHPDGLDEIRDVTIKNLATGNSDALYDDGGLVEHPLDGGEFFTSGDRVAGDGEYTFIFAIYDYYPPDTYSWQVNARNWLGWFAEPDTIHLTLLEAESPGLDRVPSIPEGPSGAPRLFPEAFE